MEAGSKIYVAGHRGMVGGAIVRALQQKGFHNIITRNSGQLDLRKQDVVNAFFADEQPAYVFLAAAKVGGIHANNTYLADFLYDNLLIAANTIHAAYESKVKKLLFLGSSCIFPKYAEQPIKEESLLTGSLEPTNEPYALAKIAGIKLCETYRDEYGCNFISAMPCNVYGQGDNYHPENSHVIPALIRKFHEAKKAGMEFVTLWGTGRPLREFIYVDDLAAACLFLMQEYNEKLFVNVGSGVEVSIAQLAEEIKKVTGYEGEIRYDSSMPDGTPRKLMDSSRLNAMGCRPATSLQDGLQKTYAYFLQEQ